MAHFHCTCCYAVQRRSQFLESFGTLDGVGARLLCVVKNSALTRRPVHVVPVIVPPRPFLSILAFAALVTNRPQCVWDGFRDVGDLSLRAHQLYRRRLTTFARLPYRRSLRIMETFRASTAKRFGVRKLHDEAPRTLYVWHRCPLRSSAQCRGIGPLMIAQHSIACGTYMSDDGVMWRLRVKGSLCRPRLLK
jgi:hypothetical protein